MFVFLVLGFASCASHANQHLNPKPKKPKPQTLSRQTLNHQTLPLPGIQKPTVLGVRPSNQGLRTYYFVGFGVTGIP